MSDTFSKMELVTGVARRRRFSTELKLALVAETMQPGMSVSYVARRDGLSPAWRFRWRLMSEIGKEALRADDNVVAGPRSAAWKSVCVSWNGCLATRPWKSRSSRRLANQRRQKNRFSCRARRFPEIPRETGQ
jgi:hypothetical protein